MLKPKYTTGRKEQRRHLHNRAMAFWYSTPGTVKCLKDQIRTFYFALSAKEKHHENGHQKVRQR